MVESLRDDQEIQIANLHRLLKHRDLVDIQESAFQSKLEKAKAGNIVQLDLKTNANSKYPTAHLIYIPPKKKVANLDFIKKTIEKHHIVIIAVSGKNIKLARKKIESVTIDHAQDTKQHRIDVIPLSLMLYDIAKNGHTTAISKLSQEEQNFIIRCQQVQKTHLPAIPVNDPLVVFHGFDKGEIVLVEFPSETCGVGSQRHYISGNTQEEKMPSIHYV